MRMDHRGTIHTPLFDADPNSVNMPILIVVDSFDLQHLHLQDFWNTPEVWVSTFAFCTVCLSSSGVASCASGHRLTSASLQAPVNFQCCKLDGF